MVCANEELAGVETGHDVTTARVELPVCPRVELPVCPRVELPVCPRVELPVWGTLVRV